MKKVKLFKRTKILNRVKIFLNFLIFFLLIAGVKVLYAEEIKIDPVGMVTVTDVNIYDAKIISQDNNNLIISFDLANGKGVQTGVKYSVKIIKETTKGQFVADEKIYDESLTLPENTTLKKEIVYTASTNLSGEYNVFISSRNEMGFPFGTAFVGKIKLTSTFKGVSILPETCFLNVVGEKENYKYNLSQGVDILSTETLKLTCSVSNSDTKPITATPMFETHYRTIYGEIVPQTETENSFITFKSKEKKNISLLLPKAILPQAYDIKVTLKNGEISSNSIVVHYVLKGVSATIQNLSFDKDYYHRGDKAILSFSWSQSADSFPGSRAGKTQNLQGVTLSGSITSGDGIKCSNLINQPIILNQSIKTDIPVRITSDCPDPRVSLSLLDSSGKILAQKDFSIKSAPQEKEPDYLLLAIFMSLIVLAIVIGLLKKHEKDFSTKNDSTKPHNISLGIFFLFIILITVGTIIPFKKIDAMLIATQIDEETGGGGGTPTETANPVSGLNISVNLNKATYGPNETMTITTEAYYNACQNATRNIVIDAYIVGYESNVKTIYNSNISGTQQVTIVNSDFRTPQTGGSYQLRLTVRGYTLSSYYSYDNNRGIIVSSTANFDIFKNQLYYHITDFYPVQADNVDNLEDLFELAHSISTIQNLLIGELNLPYISASQTGGSLDFTGTYNIPFEVIAPTTVSVEIRKVGGSWSKNVNVSVGDYVEVQWWPVNTTYMTICDCYCRDPNGNFINCGNTSSSSCGSGKNRPQLSSPSQFYLLRPTNFWVECNP